MKKIIFLILVNFLFASNYWQSLGYFIDGNKLYESAKEYNKCNIYQKCNYLESQFYKGYVMGVFDSLNKNVIEEKTLNHIDIPSFCVPKSITAQQIFDIVFEYLKNHPEKRNFAAYFLINIALTKAWPCKKK